MTFDLSEFRRPLPCTKADAKKLRMCWICHASTKHLRRSAVFCSVACKQVNYRGRKKVDALIAEQEALTKNVTVPAAIGAITVTNFGDKWPSGRQTPATGPTAPAANES